MAGDVVIIINKVLEEKSEIRGKKGNILCARHYLGKKTEPETWDNDSPYITGNQRGTILGRGKKDCSKLQRHHAGAAVRDLSPCQSLQRSRELRKVKVSRIQGHRQQRHLLCTFLRT